MHANHEVHTRAPRWLFAVCVKDTETAPEYDSCDVLHTVVTACVEGGEVEAIVFEIRQATLDDFGEDILFHVIEDNIADTVTNVDTTAHIEDILWVEDELLPRASLEKWMLCARADIREDVPVKIRLCCCMVVYGEDECLDCCCECCVALVFVDCKRCPHHITLLEDMVGEYILSCQS